MWVLFFRMTEVLIYISFIRYDNGKEDVRMRKKALIMIILQSIVTCMQEIVIGSGRKN